MKTTIDYVFLVMSKLFEALSGVALKLDKSDLLLRRQQERQLFRRHKVRIPCDLGWIDVETTGLDPEIDEIIEIAVVRTDAGATRESEVFHTLVLPEKPVRPEIAAINGYDADRWAKEAWPLAEVLGPVFVLLEGTCLAGQNPDFDWRFLEQAARRAGKPLPKLGSYRKIDVSVLAWPLVLIGLLPSVSLDSATAFLRIRGEPHRALSDVRRTIQVYRLLAGVFAFTAELAFADLEIVWCKQCWKLPASPARPSPGRHSYCSDACETKARAA